MAEAAVKESAPETQAEKKVLSLYQAEVSPLVEDADIECLVRTVAGIGDGTLITELVSYIREAGMAIHAGRGNAEVVMSIKFKQGKTMPDGSLTMDMEGYSKFTVPPKKLAGSAFITSRYEPSAMREGVQVLKKED
ncbi:hypothetical protein ADMFC3_12860 [Geovibrio sp. ADMFC3]